MSKSLARLCESSGINSLQKLPETPPRVPVLAVYENGKPTGRVWCWDILCSRHRLADDKTDIVAGEFPSGVAAYTRNLCYFLSSDDEHIGFSVIRLDLFHALYCFLPEGRRVMMTVCFEVLQTNLSDAAAVEKTNDPTIRTTKCSSMVFSCL
jgi:hypothetical protein